MYKQQWVDVFKSNFREADVGIESYSDDEVLKMAKGIIAPSICEQMNITEHWQFELYWQSFLMMKPNAVMRDAIDMSVFKERAKENQN